MSFLESLRDLFITPSIRSDPARDLRIGREFVTTAKNQAAFRIADAIKEVATAVETAAPDQAEAVYRKWRIADAQAEAAKILLRHAWEQMSDAELRQQRNARELVPNRIWHHERDAVRLFTRSDELIMAMCVGGGITPVHRFLSQLGVKEKPIDKLFERVSNSKAVFEEACEGWRERWAKQPKEPATELLKAENTTSRADSDPEFNDQVLAPTAVPPADESKAEPDNKVEEKQIRIFYSYSHLDEPFRQELEAHLSSLSRSGLISAWHDRKISAGTEWVTEIDTHLEEARVIILLVSSAFISSEYCYGVEFTRALQKHQSGEARVIPVIVRPVLFDDTPIAGIQALPRDAKPITKWADRDEAWTDVAKGIRNVCLELLSQGSK